MLKPKGRQRKKLVLKQKAEEKAEEAESDKEEAEKRMDDEEPKPVGSGVFGNIYNQFKGKVKEAFDFLMKHKGGDLLGVFHRKDVGDIDLVWGDENGDLPIFSTSMLERVRVSPTWTRR